MTELIVKCPWCKVYIIIEAINCAIFRCGILKKTGQQIPPHETRDECVRLKTEDLIYGCGGPFRLMYNTEGEYEAVICEFI
jgi:hypothetical protein